MKNQYTYKTQIQKPLRILTLNGMISDLICTSKSFTQEMTYKQITIVIDGLHTKTDIKHALMRLMPDLIIKSMQVIVIRKHQKSKASGHYTFKTGSNRSSLHGNKKFIVGIEDTQPLLNYFENKQ